jgi:hypothetical protein
MLLEHDLRRLEEVEKYILKMSAITRKDHPYYGNYATAMNDPEFELGHLLSLTFARHEKLQEKFNAFSVQVMMLNHFHPLLESRGVQVTEDEAFNEVVKLRFATEEFLAEYRKALTEGF